jgi:hypothetical protein
MLAQSAAGSGARQRTDSSWFSLHPGIANLISKETHLIFGGTILPKDVRQKHALPESDSILRAALNLQSLPWDTPIDASHKHGAMRRDHARQKEVHS